MNPEDYSNIDPSRPNKLDAYAGLISDVSRLVTEVEADQRAHLSDNSFVFDVTDSLEVEIPSYIEVLVPDLDQIIVTLNKDSAEDAFSIISISVNLLSKTKLLSISRAKDSDDSLDLLIDTSFGSASNGNQNPVSQRDLMRAESSEQFESRMKSVAKISGADFNKLIMSLVYPDKERGYKMFEDAELFTAKSFENLQDSFNFATREAHASRIYGFESNDVRFSFFKEEGQHTSFDLIFPDKHTGEPIHAESSLQTGFSIIFYTFEDVQDDPFTRGGKLRAKVPYHPTSDELYYLSSIIETEIKAINPVDVTFIGEADEGTVLDPSDLFATHEDTLVIRKEYISRILDELSFDPPDAGAA